MRLWQKPPYTLGIVLPHNIKYRFLDTSEDIG